MRICFFTQNLANYISGGRQYPWFMGHCLANAGHDVQFITDGDPLFDRDFQDFPGRNRVRIHKQDLYFGTKRADVLNIIKTCDLIMASPMTSMDYGVSLAKLYNKKVIGLLYEPQPLIDDAISNGVEIPQPQVQSGPNNSIQIDILRDFAKQLHKTDMIICNTKNGVEATRNWFPTYGGKVEYLYNGFSTHIADKVPFVPYNKRENAVVYLSRTQKYKGFGDILYIFAQTKNKPKIHYISGYIDMKQELHRKFFEACKENKVEVIIHDRINELEKFKILARSKALFFPSRFEGFGIPPAEAFYMGTPVVCYDLPVLTEIYKQYPFYLPYNQFADGVPLFDQLFDDEKLLFSRCKDNLAKNFVSEFCTVENYTDNINQMVCKLTGHPFKKIERINKPIQIEPIKQEVVEIKTDKKEKIGRVEISKIKEISNYEYVILHNPGVKLSNKIEDEALFRFKENEKISFITFNYKDGAKEMNLPDNSIPLAYTKPGCFGGVIACKVSKLEKYITEGLNLDIWELDLRLKAYTKKWYHSRRPCFEVQNKVILDGEKCRKRINRFFEEFGLAEHFEVNLNENNSVRLNPYTAIKDEVLMIIPCRTNRYLPQLMKTIENQYCKDRIKTVLVCHDPEGKFKNYSEIADTFDKYGGDHVIQVSGEFNFCKMNNRAFKEFGKNSKYVVLCNDDISLGQRTINNLISGFKYFNNVGIVGAKLLYPIDKDYNITQDWSKHKTKIQHCGVVLLKDRLCTHWYHKYPATRMSANYFRRCDAVTFGLVAIDSICYRETLLDESYPNDLNDIDFCIRATQDKWNIVYNPTAIAYHFETVTRKEFNLTDNTDARLKFRKQHSEFLSKYMSVQELLAFQTNIA